jgi:hypothetical protein
MMGIGGIIAVTGALSFILIAVKSVFFGEPDRVPAGAESRTYRRARTAGSAVNVDEVNEAAACTGRGIAGASALVLVGVFLLAFMLTTSQLEAAQLPVEGG